MKTKEDILAKNNHKIESLEPILDKMFGPVGSESRAVAEEKAYAYFYGDQIKDARKRIKITQSELAKKVGTSKSYISRVEHGFVEPKYTSFFRIMNALGYQVSFTQIQGV